MKKFQKKEGKKERRGEKRREGGGLVYLEVLASHRFFAVFASPPTCARASATSEELGALEWLGAYLGDTVHLFTTVPTRAREYGFPHTSTHVAADLLCERLLHSAFPHNPADEGSQVLADLDSPTRLLEALPHRVLQPLSRLWR